MELIFGELTNNGLYRVCERNHSARCEKSANGRRAELNKRRMHGRVCGNIPMRSEGTTAAVPEER